MIVMDLDLSDIPASDICFIGDGADNMFRFDTVVAADLDSVAHQVAVRSLFLASLPWAPVFAINSFFDYAIVNLQRPVFLYQVGKGCRNSSQTDIVLMLIAVDQLFEKFQILRLHGFCNLFLEEIAAAVGDILSTRQAHCGDRLASCPLDGCQHASFSGCDEKDRLTHATGTTGTANAVDIGFCIVRNVVIDDMADALDIQPSGCDIGGNDDIQGSGFQAFHSFLTQSLGHVTVEGCAGETSRFQLLRKFNRCDFGPYEDNHALDLFRFEDTGEGIEFMQPLDLPEALDNGVDG